MIYVNLLIIVLSLILALISRKHFSKYKGKKGIKGLVYMLGMAMGHSVLVWLRSLGLEGIENKISGLIRRSQIVSPKRLELITQEYMAGCLAVCVGILFFFNALDCGGRVVKMFSRDERNIIEREEYDGDVKEEKIYFELDGQQQMLLLNVSPVRLSEEEFHEKADIVATNVEKEYFSGEAPISSDIELPTIADGGTFSISWVSHNPEIISSKGRIKTEDISESRQVNLTMTISYYDYSAEYDYLVLVGEEEKSDTQLLVLGLEQALCNLEKENVEEPELLLPEKINNIKVGTEKSETGGRLLILGTFLGIVAMGVMLSRLKEESDKRDYELMREYPYFVDSLWLYLEAGMNTKRAFEEFVRSSNMKHMGLKNREKRKNILLQEIQYTLNEIENGQPEYQAYEELGERLNLASYKTITRHISQNLRMGTKDLRALMETEVTIALETKKENAKRLGEEASTKLIFPMIILLVVVMVLIMTPAFMGF